MQRRDPSQHSWRALPTRSDTRKGEWGVARRDRKHSSGRPPRGARQPHPQSRAVDPKHSPWRMAPRVGMGEKRKTRGGGGELLYSARACRRADRREERRRGERTAAAAGSQASASVSTPIHTLPHIPRHTPPHSTHTPDTAGIGKPMLTGFGTPTLTVAPLGRLNPKRRTGTHEACTPIRPLPPLTQKLEMKWLRMAWGRPRGPSGRKRNTKSGRKNTKEHEASVPSRGRQGQYTTREPGPPHMIARWALAAARAVGST